MSLGACVGDVYLHFSLIVLHACLFCAHKVGVPVILQRKEDVHKKPQKDECILVFWHINRQQDSSRSDGTNVYNALCQRFSQVSHYL